MTAEEFAALFDAAEHSVFRLEARQAYAVPTDDASLTAFQEGRPRPERSVRTSPWLARIAATTAAGVAWSRVRVVDRPLTEYTRWELLAYVESQAVGEQISLVDLEIVDGTIDLRQDFWLFDGDTPHPQAVILHYTPDGQVEQREFVVDVTVVAELVRRRDAATLHAVPLNEFLAYLNGRGGA